MDAFMVFPLMQLTVRAVHRPDAMAIHIATLPDCRQCQNDVPYLCTFLPALLDKVLDQLLILAVQLTLLQAAAPMCTQCGAFCY